MSAPLNPPTPNPTPAPPAAPAVTPPTPVATPVAAPVQSAPVATAPVASDQTAPPTTAATPNTVVDEATLKAEAEELKKIKSEYTKAQFQKVFGKLRRSVIFFIVIGLLLYANIWMFARAWQLQSAGENENWFHEGLFVFFTIGSLALFYFKLYRKSAVYVEAQNKREAAEKAAEAAKRKLEEEQKKQAFMGLIRDFQAANSYEQKSVTMAKLLTVGVESTLLRQQAVDLLTELTAWMPEQQAFLINQNLIIWRLKNTLFEQSERFPVESSTQDLAIKAINITEAIIKKHLADFAEGNTQTMLDLSGKAIPTLTLPAQTIPIGSIKLDNALLWQASFSETKLKDLSFAGADLQTASFWRAQLQNIDFADTNLRFAKLRTNLQEVHNLTAPQFFSTKEWELCYLSEEQQNSFFADTDNVPSGAKDQWDSSEPRRRKLYFQLAKKANTLT